MAYVIGIAEIVLWTADRERALTFYRDLLGLAVISPPTLANVFLEVGGGVAGVPEMLVLQRIGIGDAFEDEWQHQITKPAHSKARM
ncbi:MAG: VOC family protein [Chloroflexales bacterium]|nr:VOC family protein [Chloroflexales bacterium]